jgi:hypothetical protein
MPKPLPRIRLRPLALLLIALPLLSAALAQGCHPPDRDGAWELRSVYSSNLRRTATSATSHGPWHVADSEYNDATTTASVELHYQLRNLWEWSLNLLRLGKANGSSKETLRVSVATPPGYTAQLLQRRASNREAFRFDVRCRWQDRLTGVRRTTLAYRNRSGSRENVWTDWTVRYR